MSEGKDETGDKSFEPSEKKLLEARRKGDIARSTDLMSSSGLLAITGLLFVAGSGLLILTQELLSDLFQSASSPWGDRWSAQARSSEVWGTVLSVFLYAFLVLSVPIPFVLASATFQRALSFSVEKISPRLSRISPFSNFKNKFGREGIFSFFKSAFKLAIFSSIFVVFIVNYFSEIASSLRVPPDVAIWSLFYIAAEFLLYCAILSLVLGGIDYLVENKLYISRMMMTRKEIEDESKETEGDPRTKHHRRERAVQIATQQMMSEVPDASVIIVNPTHYAVALKWERDSGRAPIVVAKGIDHVARKIRECGQENGVPIHSDPPTARALFASCQLGEEVPRSQFRRVAAAIRFAERMRDKVKDRMGR